MANGGEPPLSDSDDPFVVLGIPRDADDKAVKQAYAKLIRRFRPDRAPSEFQRVHAAFELIKELRRVGATHFELVEYRNEEHVDPDLPREPPPPDLDTKRIFERMREAFSASPERAAAVIEELLAEHVPLDVLMEPPTERFLLLRHPRLSWTLLRRHTRDLAAVLAVWETAFDDAIEHDPPRAFTLLDDEQLRLDAADHPRIAASALARIAALGWRRSSSLEDLFRRYCTAIPRGHYVDHLIDSVWLELAAARSLADVDGPARWLAPLLIAARIGTKAQRTAIARSMLAGIYTNVEGLLLELHHLQRRVDLTMLFELMYLYLPGRHFRLDAMPPSAFERLTTRLRNIGYRKHAWPIRIGIVAASALAIPLVGVVPVGAALGLAGIYLLATQERTYRRIVRPRLARTIVRCAVTPEVIARWIQLNGRMSGRLWHYEPGIRNDATLYTFAMFCAFITAVGDLADEPELA